MAFSRICKLLCDLFLHVTSFAENHTEHPAPLPLPPPHVKIIGQSDFMDVLLDLLTFDLQPNEERTTQPRLLGIEVCHLLFLVLFVISSKWD
jgi:hypothetical protein